MKYFLWACAIGAISAVSLPLGSWIGLQYRFTRNAISIMAAFGGGALLAALSVEMVAPTTLALIEPSGDAGGVVAGFLAMVGGCVAGGVLYVALDAIVNHSGGFMRRPATLLRHYRKLGRGDQEQALRRVAAHPLFRDFPAEHLETLLGLLEPRSFADGDVVVEEGQPAEEVFLIQEGTLVASHAGEGVVEFGPEKVIVGLLPIFTNTPYSMTATAKGGLKCLRIARSGLDQLRRLSPEFDRTCQEIAAEGLESLGELLSERNERILQWVDASRRSLHGSMPVPQAPVFRKAGKEHHGAPLAVWLGILLDGIPESVVIGAGVLGILSGALAVSDEVRFLQVIPFTLVAGLFLANLPEALSSSASMLAQGWGRARIFTMWFALMVIVSIGSGAGYLMAESMNHTWMAFIEGLAAGAMLTMIAAAMIPEAVLMGSGNTVGLSTLAGFVAAILFKLLE
jgi:zinc transporter ZupT